MHLAIPVFQREEPLVRKVPLVEGVVHGAAVAEGPQGLATLVDPLPCGAGRRRPRIARPRRSASFSRIRRPRSCPFSTRFSSRRNSIASRCSRSSQPNSAATIRCNGVTRGVYVKAISTQFLDGRSLHVDGADLVLAKDRRAGRASKRRQIDFLIAIAAKSHSSSCLVSELRLPSRRPPA